MTTRRKLLVALGCLLIVCLCLAVSVTLIKSKKTPKRKPRPFLGPLVETVLLEPADHTLTIQAHGTVQPSQAIDLIAQVSGTVTWLAPQFQRGSFFNAGQPLFRLDDTDYQLALQRAKADLAKSRLELAKIQGQADIARREWQLQKGEGLQEPEPLVLYTPQLANAKAMVTASEAALRQAELNVERTTVKAPFSCYVQQESIDLGQYVRAATTLGRLVGSEQAEIITSLPLADIDWIDLPQQGSDSGSQVTIFLDTGQGQLQWQGRVSHLLADIDSSTRMAKLVVYVSDPYQLQAASRKTLPLAMGSFVQLAITGKTMAQVVAISRSSLRDQQTIWLVDEDDRLEISQVKLLRKDKSLVFLAAQQLAGRRLVTSNLSGAANGLVLRYEGQQKGQRQQPGGKGL